MTASPDPAPAVVPSSDVAPEAAAAAQQRSARSRHYVMTAPTHFTVDYRINPWMDPSTPVDRRRAVAQWERLAELHRALGHRVDLIDPVPGLPDMVYTANAGLVVGRTAIVTRFRHHQRDAESAAYAEWLTARGYRAAHPRYINEGQGDFLLVDGIILAGSGFRTDPRAHAEAAEILQLPVVSLELTDPHYYHLDTALAVLDDTTIAYHPPAFSDRSQARLRELFPNAMTVGHADTAAFGLNAVSDGRNVVLARGATTFVDQLRAAGFEPIEVDMSELLKGGGSVKCCTLEAYP